RPRGRVRRHVRRGLGRHRPDRHLPVPQLPHLLGQRGGRLLMGAKTGPLARWALVAALWTAACADLDVTNLNAPDRARAVSTPQAVEALFSGSCASWWGGSHYDAPGPMLSVAADAGSASWANFGMYDMAREPREPWKNDPSYEYAYVNH